MPKVFAGKYMLINTYAVCSVIVTLNVEPRTCEPGYLNPEPWIAYERKSILNDEF